MRIHIIGLHVLRDKIEKARRRSIVLDLPTIRYGNEGRFVGKYAGQLSILCDRAPFTNGRKLKGRTMIVAFSIENYRISLLQGL